MKSLSKIISYLAIPTLCLGLGGVVNAATDEGYVSDSSHAAVKDSTGDCVRSTFSDGQIPPECGGAVAKAPAKAERAERVEAPRGMTTKSALEGKALFATNKATLKPAGQAALAKLAREIKSTPNVQEVHVIGYTDSRGSHAHNQRLSENRALTVKRYLESKGVRNVSSQGRGEADPVASNATENGRAHNRRVEIEVVTQ
ncbi:OmpA-OmpF porin, OOP family [Gammaproteobacteria bacterium]